MGKSKSREKAISLLLVLILLPGLVTGCSRSKPVGAKTDQKLELAVKYLSENKYDKAILAYQDVIKVDKKEVKAYQGLGKVYTLQGKYDKAEEVYARGLKVLTGDQAVKLNLSLAGMYIDSNDLTAAEKAYREVLSKDKSIIEGYQGLALVYRAKGDNQQALALLEQAVQANNKNIRGYTLLAEFYAQIGEKDKALQEAVKSLALDVNQGEAYRVLKDMYSSNWLDLIGKAAGIPNKDIAEMIKLYAYYEHSQYQEALVVYNEHPEKQKFNQKAEVLAAICLLKCGSQEKSDQLIREITESNLNTWVMADVARYFLLAGDKEKAFEWAEKSFAANGQNLEAVKLLVQLYAEKNKDLARIFTVKTLVYDWQPIAITIQNLNQKSIELLNKVILLQQKIAMNSSAPTDSKVPSTQPLTATTQPEQETQGAAKSLAFNSSDTALTDEEYKKLLGPDTVNFEYAGKNDFNPYWSVYCLKANGETPRHNRLGESISQVLTSQGTPKYVIKDNKYSKFYEVGKVTSDWSGTFSYCTKQWDNSSEFYYYFIFTGGILTRVEVSIY